MNGDQQFVLFLVIVVVVSLVAIVALAVYHDWLIRR